MVAFRASDNTLTGETDKGRGIKIIFGDAAVPGCNESIPALQLNVQNPEQAEYMRQLIELAIQNSGIGHNPVRSDATGTFILGNKVIQAFERQFRISEGLHPSPVGTAE